MADPGPHKAKINYGVVPFPVKTPGQTSVAPLGGEAWTVPLTADEAKMTKAAELVKCMNTDENQVSGPRRADWCRPNSPWPTVQDRRPKIAGFVDSVGTARARTGKLGPKWPEAAKTSTPACSGPDRSGNAGGSMAKAGAS